ncbi:hypothetical protein POM88_054784 [Heracleum sosnowskyi]|uniref:ATP-dependent DNA helicase n=1 Tax=Heracleum sosnowskyi TaxID=360622 RepID=A0AAD8GMW9_9APIA|nr:hypothetical protein POM88_054784 [Heracleum sosnowskyi]
MFEEQPDTTFHLRLPANRTRDGREYNIPTESEVGLLIVGDLTQKNFERDVTKGITHIDELHPSYMSMTYPLIHPFGEDGYRLGIALVDKGSQPSKRQGISNKVATAHAIHQEGTTIWQSHSMFIHDRVPKKGKRFHVPDLQLTKQQIEAYTLIEVEGLMQKLGKSLRDIDGMPQPDSSLTRDLGNRLLNEELDYDRPKLKALHQKNINALNESQKRAYDAIVQSVQLDEGKIFFVSGHGGTGKTFLWNTITSKFRSESMIVLPVATSGIASLLLPNGRTAHSRFRIPLDVTAESTCEIKHGTQLAKLLQKTSLIIWDEAPMTNKYCFEALDKTLRDILSTRYENSRSRPFGGITMVFGGDFRQILPVIPQGSRSDIIDASLNSSYLWPYFEIYELKQNMRLRKEGISEAEAESITLFDKWLLQIGDGSMYDDVEQELIRIPPDICKPPTEEPIKEIVDAVYPSLLENYKNPAYLKERAILTPKNETVDELNGYLMNMIPGEGRTYLSSDSVCKASIKTDDDDLLYPPEFLHTLQFSGIPNHDIKLKEGTPIMLLRNLNQSEGLCNGTRLIVTRLGKWSIRGDIISGKNDMKHSVLQISCTSDIAIFRPGQWHFWRWSAKWRGFNTVNIATYLGQSTATAASNVNAWSGAAMLTPFLGAFITDSYLGRYRTIIAASFLYVLVLFGVFCAPLHMSYIARDQFMLVTPMVEDLKFSDMKAQIDKITEISGNGHFWEFWINVGYGGIRSITQKAKGIPDMSSGHLKGKGGKHLEHAYHLLYLFVLSIEELHLVVAVHSKDEASSRKEIIDRIEQWLSACEKENWLEDYNLVSKNWLENWLGEAPGLLDNLVNFLLLVCRWRRDGHSLVPSVLLFYMGFGAASRTSGRSCQLQPNMDVVPLGHRQISWQSAENNCSFGNPDIYLSSMERKERKST